MINLLKFCLLLVAALATNWAAFPTQARANFDDLCSGAKNLIQFEPQEAERCFVPGGGEPNCQSTLRNMIARNMQFRNSSSSTCEQIAEMQQSRGRLGQSASYDQAIQVAQRGLAAVNQLSQQTLELARLSREDGRRNVNQLGRQRDSGGNARSVPQEQTAFQNRATTLYSSNDLNRFKTNSMEENDSSRVTSSPDWQRQAKTISHNSRFIRELLREKEKLDQASSRIQSMISELQARSRDTKTSSPGGSGLNPSALAQMAPALAGLAQKPNSSGSDSGISGQNPNSTSSLLGDAAETNAKKNSPKGTRIDGGSKGGAPTPVPGAPDENRKGPSDAYFGGPNFGSPSSSDISQGKEGLGLDSKGNSVEGGTGRGSRLAASTPMEGGGSSGSASLKSKKSEAEALQPFQEELTGGFGHGGGGGAGGYGSSRSDHDRSDQAENLSDEPEGALPEVFHDVRDSWEEEQQAEANGALLLDSEVSLFERVRKCHRRRLLEGKVMHGLGEDLDSLNLFNKNR